MLVLFHQPARRLFIQALTIFIVIFTSALAQAAQVTLAWDNNNPAPEGYRVFQRIEGGAYDYSTPVWPQTGDNPQLTTCIIDNLADNTNYHFVVRAYAGNDQSGDSNEVSFRSDVQVPTSYTLSVAAGPNGSISPGTVTVKSGGSQTFAITPQLHYHVADVIVDGNSVGPVPSYTFSNVTAAHTISASFSAEIFTISASAGANGSISPSGTATVAYGASKTYSVSAAAGYHVSDVLVDGNSVGALSSYTFSNVTAAHTISASFSAETFTISASAGANGSISPSGTVAVAGGTSQSFNISADAGFEIETLAVDGVSMGIKSSYTFNGVDANHSITATFIPANQPPVSDAGPDQVVDETQVVTLSGLNSRDPDDGITRFQWRQIQGVSVALSAPDQEETTFTAPDVDADGQALVFELTVTDSNGATAKDSCIINVTWINMAPVAQAGPDQTVSEGTAVTLSASASTDPDGGIVNYEWVQLQGPQVALSNAQTATPSFTSPDVGSQGASLVFQLTVTDAGGLQDTDNCNVSVTWLNQEPVADAGADQQVRAGAQVTLDGSQSKDPDGSTAGGSGLIFQWRQTDGPPVILSDASAVRPVFEVPSEGFDGSLLTFELTVTDDGGLQGVDVCRVTVQPANPQPVPDVDTTPPVLTVDGAAGDHIATESNKINMSGTAMDDRQVDRVVWVNDRGQSDVAVGTQKWRIDGMRLHRWENTVTLTVYDIAGNFQSKTIIIDVGGKR